jgi:hypothetical protein
MISQLRHVKPVYGWGWLNADGVTRDIPEPFRLGCDDPDALAGVVLGDHEFSGATARLSPRHATPDGCFNVEIELDAKRIASGYAEA